jgi:hypothetical protein
MKEEGSSKPKVTKKPRLKIKPTPTPSLSGVMETSSIEDDNLNPISKFEKATIDNIVAQALLKHKNELEEYKKVTRKEMNHLNLFAQEYLSSYAIIGFTMNSEKVCIINMPTPKDEGALVDLLRSTFIEIANNRS